MHSEMSYHSVIKAKVKNDSEDMVWSEQMPSNIVQWFER